MTDAWIVSTRPSVRSLFVPADSDLRIEYLDGLIGLLRRAGEPAVIAVDGTEHDLQLSDVVLKIQLRYPDADLVALYDETPPGRGAALLERGVDAVVYPTDQWRAEVLRIVAARQRVAKVGWIGKSDALRQLATQTLQAAGADIAVLVTGESGTGKELVAQALHDLSPRSRAPFIPVNTGAIPETLLESELFGHEKGAFTGASSRHAGIFEAARGGTVFLDEIGDMPPATQVKLLRVLESRRFRRVGGTVELDCDVRVISATNTDLSALEQSGRFRRDLYYRLSAITLYAVPLRERRADILPLLFWFWRNLTGVQRPPQSIDPEAVRLLWQYDWPGNVRELRNFAEAAAVAAPAQTITPDHALQYVQRQRGQNRNLPVLSDRPSFGGDQEILLHAVLHLGQQVRELRRIVEERLPETAAEEPEAFRAPSTSIADAERRAIETALIETGGNRREAARRLRIGERTLYRKLKEYGLK